MREEIGRLWRVLGRRKKDAWPRMEEGKYRSFRAVHPFDEQFGVETSGLIYELPSGHQHDLYNNGYFAVAPSVFHAIMRAMRERLHLDFQRFSFIDLGSGKGRALLLASDYPFREIIGVELSPKLDRVARDNIARYALAKRAPRAPVISMTGDATEFSWPAGPLIVYMWNCIYATGHGASIRESASFAQRAAPRVVPGVYPPGIGVDARRASLAHQAMARGVHDERRGL